MTALDGRLEPIQHGLQRVSIENDAVPRIRDKPLLTEPVHILSDDLARSPDVSGQHLVGEWHHPYGSVVLRNAQPLGEADQRAGEPPLNGVERKALNPVLALLVASGQHLE